MEYPDAGDQSKEMNRFNTAKPVVVILLATYNGERFLREQLLSLKRQTYQNFVCYIHDDGSKDDTLAIAREFCQTDPGHFAIMDGAPCGGAKDNFMFMLRNAPDAPYYMLCDQDDVWYKRKIEVSLSAMRETEQHDGIVCVYSDLEVVDARLNTIANSCMTYHNVEPYPRSLRDLLCGNRVAGCTIMMTAALREKCCTLKDDSLVFMHDWWIALVAMSCGTLRYIDRPLLKYRQHENNVVGARIPQEPGKLRHILLYLTHPRREIRKSMEAQREIVRRCFALDPFVDDANPDKQFISQAAALETRGKIVRAIGHFRLGLIDWKHFWRVLWV